MGHEIDSNTFQFGYPLVIATRTHLYVRLMTVYIPLAHPNDLPIIFERFPQGACIAVLIRQVLLCVERLVHLPIKDGRDVIGAVARAPPVVECGMLPSVYPTKSSPESPPQTIASRMTMSLRSGHGFAFVGMNGISYKILQSSLCINYKWIPPATTIVRILSKVFKP